MRRLWTIIGVADVAVALRWYQSLLGLAMTPAAHGDFGQVLDTDGTVLLCLHAWGAHEHPPLKDPGPGAPGKGLLLFFRVADFDATLQRARRLVERLEHEPHLSPHTGTMEFALRDLDGHYVMASALSMEDGRAGGRPSPMPTG
ncbi:VOC family protein [Cognatiluteimonas telluris]|uniref:VOC family protein n=1 Tax=Cognatiluteimonas telluris TaxID=1104775 RepID=UPI00140936E4